MTRDYVRDMKILNFKIKELNDTLKAMKAVAIQEAEDTGVYSWKWSDMGLDVVVYEKTNVDAKELKKRYPEIYAELSHKTIVKKVDFK